MRASCVGLALAGLMAIGSPAVAESRLVPVYEVNKVELKENANWNSIKNTKKIHRITTKEEFEKLGFKKTHVDFATRDLVIVHGHLGCAKGTIEAKAENKAVVFTVKVTEHCTHDTDILHLNPCIGYFAVNKDAVLVDKAEALRLPLPIGIPKSK